MLPETIVVIASTLLFIQQGLCSPVYTMQPAFITANIGTLGRNIRHLPCVSKRSGLSGTCMFAIDCLKANGTHLGTCIDRFYFGSCCHIEPGQDFSENVIDTALIPVRQPPFRLSSTTDKTTVEKNEEKDKITNTSMKTTPSTSPAIVTDKHTSTIEPLKSTEMGSTTEATNTTQKIITAIQKITSLLNLTTQSIIIATSSKPTTPSTTENEINTSTESYRLSTFQSVEDGTSETTTTKIRTTTKTTKPTPKPVKPPTIKPQTVKPRPKPTVKPIPITIKVPSRPTTRPTTKPSRITTKQPVSTKLTTKPTIKPTKPLITIPIRPLKTTPKPITIARPITTTLTTKYTPTTSRITATVKPSTTTITSTTPKHTTTTQKSTTVAKPSEPISTSSPLVATTSTTEIPNKIVDSVVEEFRPQASTTSNISNEVLVTTKPIPAETASGNTVTNEIEAIVKPEKKPDGVTTTERTTQLPGLVTWAIVNEQTTKNPANQTAEDGDSDWTPITPPDGWVLLPSVGTTLQSAPVETSTTNISLTTEANITQVTSVTTMSSSDTEPSTTPEMILIGNDTSVTQEPTSSSTVTQSTLISPSGITPKPINTSDFTDVCGRRMYPEARIVGGKNSGFGQWPWQISLRQWKTSTYLHKCGAALLNENWAITAAHCVDNVPPSDLLLRLGEYDLSTDTEPFIHQERRVQIVASHPQFDSRTFEYDLALLRFYEPVQFQANIVPVCVPQDDENFVGRTAHVTGWGRLYEDGPLPSILQEVSVPVINNTVCEAMYRTAGYIEHIPNIFICAGWKHGGFDSCEGDSGGPMVIQRKDKRFLLAGIISWGIGCAEPNQPGVYTRISEFRDWINQILQF